MHSPLALDGGKNSREFPAPPRVHWAVLLLLIGCAEALVCYLFPGPYRNFAIYAVAAATLGGFDSPIGAVVGGLVIGIAESLISSYVSFVGDSLGLGVALVILLLVLLVRPSGLFGSREIARV